MKRHRGLPGYVSRRRGVRSAGDCHACPFCLLTLEDMVKTSGHEKDLQVMDVAEVLAEAMLPLPLKL